MHVPRRIPHLREPWVRYTPLLEQNLSVADRAVRLGIALTLFAVAPRATRSRTLLLMAGAMAGVQLWEALAGYCLFYDLAGWNTLDQRLRTQPRNRHPWLRARSMVPIGVRGR
jgi:hypothetical protein